MATNIQGCDKEHRGRCYLRTVTWTDERGFVRQALVRNGDPDETAPERGIPNDPPDLDRLDWEELKRELHNELARRGLYDQGDVERHQSGVSSAVRRVITKRILALYKETEYDN